MYYLLITPYLLLSLTLTDNLTIDAHKIQKGQPAPIEGALLSPSSWLLLRSQFGEVDRCKPALDKCVASCADQIEMILASCGAREKRPEDDLIIGALNIELTQARASLELAEKKRERWKWLAIGASSVALTMGGAVWLYSRGR